MKHVIVAGIQYEGETEADMRRRESRMREDNDRSDREQERMRIEKLRPWWEKTVIRGRVGGEQITNPAHSTPVLQGENP